jgi:hypothetical protein
MTTPSHSPRKSRRSRLAVAIALVVIALAVSAAIYFGPASGR